MSGDRVLPPGMVLTPLDTSPPVPTSGVDDRPAPVVAKPHLPRHRRAAAAGSANASRGRAAGQPGRFQVLNDFVDVSMRGVSDRAVRAWLVLYRDTKPNGTAATGLADIARRAGYSRKTAQRAVHELIERGLARRIRCGGKGKGPNVYRVVGAAERAPTAG
jgi:hypothetical protein